jgi:hypothetical protein
VLGHLKINRAIATRYDQLVDSFLGMLYLARIIHDSVDFGEVSGD